MTASAIVCGGSIGGLFVAAALRKLGWKTLVLERSPIALAGRGAGIVTHPELTAALSEVGASREDIGINLRERVAYDFGGARVHAMEYPQLVTSWDRMYQFLRALVPDTQYRLNQTVERYVCDTDYVAAIMEDGQRHEGDVLIGADGFRSAVRAQWQPKVMPDYSDYVVWRTVAAEADLPDNIRADIFNAFGFYLPNGAQVIGYPIAGPGNDLRPGHRRYNLVWYVEVESDQLGAMLTDADGHRHPLSIPPPQIRNKVIEDTMRAAEARLPRPFAEIFHLGDRPFFTPIYDHVSPIMGQGRVALAGDAACTVRPHLGMGVTKAAEDALSLARHLATAPVAEALVAYSNERVTASRIAYDASRELGRLIFDCDRTVNQDGSSHRAMHQMMRDTAAIPEALRNPVSRP